MQAAEKQVTVAIIGSAGRKQDGAKMSRPLFDAMVERARSVIEQQWALKRCNVVLVSGGAAWSDHVAVRLFTESVCTSDEPFAGLRVHLPCGWTEAGDKSCAVDNGKRHWSANPGPIMNSLHASFSKSLACNTLSELNSAKALGALFTVSAGFHARNALVAKADRMVAFTWGLGAEPADGGTAHTWSLAKTPHKLHVPLPALSETLAKTS